MKAQSKLPSKQGVIFIRLDEAAKRLCRIAAASESLSVNKWAAKQLIAAANSNERA